MENENSRLQTEANIVQALRSVYDPEIPVNIYELGLIYEIRVNDDYSVDIEMTLTAPNCPVADDIVMEVKEKVEAVEGVQSADVKIVFDPPWAPELMSEEAKLELGML
jgi:FeS assembly SUF system protein